jgi:hypothetical protein
VCGDLDSAVEDDRVWMTCTCGAAISRTLERASPRCDAPPVHRPSRNVRSECVQHREKIWIVQSNWSDFWIRHRRHCARPFKDRATSCWPRSLQFRNLFSFVPEFHHRVVVPEFNHGPALSGRYAGRVATNLSRGCHSRLSPDGSPFDRESLSAWSSGTFQRWHFVCTYN